MSQYIDPGLLAKQVAGLPLTGDEARTMISGLQRCIEEEPADYDVTVVVLMLSAVGSRYYEDVWDMLLVEGLGDAQENPDS